MKSGRNVRGNRGPFQLSGVSDIVHHYYSGTCMTGAMFEEEMDETDQKCRECGVGGEGGGGQLESGGEREREREREK